MSQPRTPVGRFDVLQLNLSSILGPPLASSRRHRVSPAAALGKFGNKGRIRFPNPNPGTRRRRRLNKGAPQARFFWAYSALCANFWGLFGTLRIRHSSIWQSRPNLILSAEQMKNLEKRDAERHFADSAQ